MNARHLLVVAPDPSAQELHIEIITPGWSVPWLDGFELEPEPRQLSAVAVAANPQASRHDENESAT